MGGRKMEKNNSGLSIIELVVAVAIFAIASLSIYEFVIIASKHYQNQTVEVNLQY
ncbi:MAG: prepilin-type N-terminal cleavage/methylation domain-containing protein, partial [Agathobacter sp.]|nr:prepilin-type N-terminal cleavage/methylation domain-containing protein [Agathobacter sp.]